MLRGRHRSVPHFFLDLLVSDQVILRLDGGCVFDAREFVLRNDNSVVLAGLLGGLADLPQLVHGDHAGTGLDRGGAALLAK